MGIIYNYVVKFCWILAIFIFFIMKWLIEYICCTMLCIVHHCDVTMSMMASKSLAYQQFTQPFVQEQIKEKSKLHVTGLCEGNLPVTGEFPAQRTSNTENVSIWWRHHVHILKKTSWQYLWDMTQYNLLGTTKWYLRGNINWWWKTL